MLIAKTISLLSMIVMGSAIFYGLTAGDFNAEGAMLLAMPWGVVSLVDLFTGFTLFSMWIVFREKSAFRSIGWIALLIFLGFFTGALYVFIALQTSGGDWSRFFMGKRWQDVK